MAVKEHAIELAQSWLVTAGVCHGLQQRALIGTIHVGAIDAAALPAIEEGLQALLDEPLPAAAPHEEAATRIATLFAFMHGAIQRQNRVAVSRPFSVRVQEAQSGGRSSFALALPAPDPSAAKAALACTRRTVNHILSGNPLHAQAERERIHELLRVHADPGLNMFFILTAAYKLDIPVQMLSRATAVFGTGSRSRWMDSTTTDATSSIGVTIAQSKLRTARLLRTGGLPGARNTSVTSADAALAAARELGYPVVVKPDDLQHGTGVTADVRDDATLRRAYEHARSASEHVLVEKWVDGFTHRITVFNGRVLRVARRIAGGVVGDGASKVSELVSRQQLEEPLQRARRRLGRMLLELDDEALGLLQQNGMSAEYVPKEGEYLRLRRRDNVNAGGTTQALALADAHPDNLRLAVDATAAVRLDFAGVDLIMKDISQSWLETESLICEINPKPQLGTRSDPAVYEGVLGEIVGARPRIPARLVVCASTAGAQQAAMQRLLRESPAGGISAESGLWLGGERVTAPFDESFSAGVALLRRTDVEAATCIMTLATLATKGLPTNRWDRIEWPADGELGGRDIELLPAAREMALPHEVKE